jgi:hypothetical protein
VGLGVFFSDGTASLSGWGDCRGEFAGQSGAGASGVDGETAGAAGGCLPVVSGEGWATATHAGDLADGEVETETVPWLWGLSLGLLGVALVTSWQIAPPWGLLMGLVLLAHEAGHGWQARRYGVRLLWPLWVPTAELGSFGAVTRFATAVPHRTALWDIAAAGPGAGAIVSLTLLLVGLGLSAQGGGMWVEPEWLQASLLVEGLARLVLGAGLAEPLVRLHPLVTVGWVGLVVTALNVLPVGCLDGGRMIQAVYGDRMLRATGLVSLVVVGFLGLNQPVLLSWGILILFIQRRPERPTLEDMTEPDDLRVWLTWGLLLFGLCWCYYRGRRGSPWDGGDERTPGSA